MLHKNCGGPKVETLHFVKLIWQIKLMRNKNENEKRNKNEKNASHAKDLLIEGRQRQSLGLKKDR